MNANEYQRLAWSTAKPFYKETAGGDSFNKLQITCSILALNGEAGELANDLKKMIEAGEPWNEKTTYMLIEELGDVQWYIAHTASMLGVTLEDIMGRNVSKLQERYKNQMPQGKNYHGKL